MQPASEQILNVSFTPQNAIEAERGQRITFVGQLKLNVKTADGGFNSQVVYLVGVGGHPEVTLSSSRLDIPAIFPGQISQSINQLQIVNDSDQALEFFIDEYDDVHAIEKLALDAIAQLDGAKTVVKKNKTVENRYALEVASIADGGRVFD